MALSEEAARTNVVLWCIIQIFQMLFLGNKYFLPWTVTIIRTPTVLKMGPGPSNKNTELAEGVGAFAVCLNKTVSRAEMLV